MTTRPVRDLLPGDMIDLEGVDISPANEQTWLFEFATVESVSTRENPSGGWADGYLASDEGAAMAIIYVENGAVPAVVPADAMFVIEAHREPFAGADALDGA